MPQEQIHPMQMQGRWLSNVALVEVNAPRTRIPESELTQTGSFRGSALHAAAQLNKMYKANGVTQKQCDMSTPFSTNVV